MFDKFINLLNWGGPSTVIIIVVIALIFIASVFWGIKHRIKKEKVTSASLDTPVKITKKETAEADTDEPEDAGYKQLRGTGKYKAMVYCADGISIDFTTIPYRLGNIHTLDTSLPQPGGNYIVKELSDGTLAAYDPRDTVMETKETPDWAWLAINCKVIVQNFWRVPNAWWKSVGMWFAAGMILVVFICFLAVFGG
jgi:hypothetical protein